MTKSIKSRGRKTGTSQAQRKEVRITRKSSVRSRTHIGRPLENYVVINPRGKRVQVADMPAFCEKHGLDAGAMYRLASGKQETHQGKWRCEKAS